MGEKHPKVDEYIARSSEFARPILTHFRNLVHQTCPEVEEAMKWSFPHFMYKGMLCSMASFKNHCAIGFWKEALLFGKGAKVGAMGQFGRITSFSDLPPDQEMVDYIKKAARLNETGVKAQKPVRKKTELKIPKYFMAALKKNRKALATFEKLPPSHKSEYVQWVTEAKTDATRDRRLGTAVQWMAEGKSRNWKYIK